MEDELTHKEELDRIGRLILDFINMHRDINGDWPKVQYLAQRFGKRVKVLGFDSINAYLHKSPLFKLLPYNDGRGYKVKPVGRDPISQRILMAFGRTPRLDIEELKLSLKGSGINIMEFLDALGELKLAGIVLTESEAGREVMYLTPERQKEEAVNAKLFDGTISSTDLEGVQSF